MVENYYLDFKTSEQNDYTSRRSLFTSDNKNYAKAISAFGNSDGGVLIWGVGTGKSDADYATEKKPITNVSNFLSLLEGFTSILTSPQHQSVVNKIIFEYEEKDVGYVITHIPKSSMRPLQVLNDDYRYYIRAGGSSLPASDIFLRSLFGKEPQSDVFITWGASPVKITEGDVVKIEINVVLHNGGENIGKNINGYVQVGGRDLAIEVNQNSTDSFSYSVNRTTGMKIGFMSKNDFRLGIEQEVLPLTIHIPIKKPITETEETKAAALEFEGDRLNPFSFLDKIMIVITAVLGLVWIINDPASKIGGSNILEFGGTDYSAQVILVALMLFLNLLVTRIIR
jgi:hypothetical protein